MDVKKVPELLSISGHPVGFGGCRNAGGEFDCCEYNISVFDDILGESVHDVSGNFVKLHHCSLSESDASVLVQLENLTILHDDQWNLRMFMAQIKEKREKIFDSYTQSCLVDAGIFANKSKEAVKTNDPFAAVWIKCAAYFLADTLFSINAMRPSPVHMLEITRNLKKNDVNQTFSLVHQMLGMERASTSVLARMVKSTAGFSDMVENNGSSAIIKRKYEYLIENSLLSDCYFYLGYINRNNIVKIKSQIHKNPEYIHVLKTALDIESDHLTVDKQAAELLQRINELLSDIKDKK
ncbi:MAG: hypothetical protein KGI27_11875 [Thaumarchaeota archaeon]|nr:hypothetical protein [Nitrososphaerota archaeon]